MKCHAKFLILLLAAAMLLSGCVMQTVDELYCLPKRPQADDDLQKVIDQAMIGLTYSAPFYGENRQMLHTADLDGDGTEEYILLAKDNNSLTLKMMIFRKLAVGYALTDTIDGYGTAFDFVDFANLDDYPGEEIIVGRQVGDGVVRSAAIYRLSDGNVTQLLEASYSELLRCDLDGDGRSELLLAHPGDGADAHGKVLLYRYADGQLRQSSQLTLFGSVNSTNEMEAITLEDGSRAVLLISKEGNVPSMAVFSMHEGALHYIYGAVGVEKLYNHYIYPTDIDGDGAIDFPRTIPMKNAADSGADSWIVWYGMDAAGNEQEGMYTYYNYEDKWYLHINQLWIKELTVTRADGVCTFTNSKKEIVMTIYALYGSNRNERAEQLGGVALGRSETVTFVAVTGPGAQVLGITEQRLKKMFYPVELKLYT